jgi:hypothetical protein
MVLGIVPLVAVASTLIALNRVRITPLGAARRGRRRPPQLWRLAPLTAGILGMVEVARLSRRDDPAGFGLLEFLSLAAPLSILVGLVLAGPWVCMWGARGLARLSRRATTLIAARRIASDPYTAFRAVSGVALASFVATLFGLGAASQTGDSGRPTPLDPGVLAIHVEGAPGAALAPLLAGDVVVARSGPVRSLVVACTDLANVTDLTCPRPPDETVPLDSLFRPERFLEPGLNAAELPIATIFVRTDGTPAAEERVRTLAATIAPHALTRSYRDYDPAGHPQPIADELSEGALNWLNEGFVLVLAFVLLVAACSLTIAVVSGLMERRRPFALLRASGVRLGELRHIVMLESAVALVCTVLAGMGTALLAAAVVVPTDRWVLPSVWFFVILATATAVAFAVTTIALPLTNRMTGHDSVRFE